MKKLITLLVTLSMIATTLVGCDSSVNTSDLLDAYEEKINELGVNFDSYDLIYLNDDKIPELFALDAPETAVIFYMKDDSVYYKSFKYSNKFGFLAGEGLVREQIYDLNDNGYGENPCYERDLIYQFTEEGFNTVLTGTNRDYWKNGELLRSERHISDLEGNVDENEYQQALDDVFDLSDSTEGNGYSSFEELRETLK